jgi:hypothetical protein
MDESDKKFLEVAVSGKAEYLITGIKKRYPERINGWDYSAEYKVCYECKNGAIRISRSNWLFVTTALKEKSIGLEEIGNGILELPGFCRHLLNSK